MIDLLVGALLGFVTYCITAGEEGDYSRSLRINGIHIHHWMYLIIPLSVCLFTIQNQYITGFCIGGIVQGLVMYSDAFVIFY
jgi:uncharacterized membrane protein